MFCTRNQFQHKYTFLKIKIHTYYTFNKNFKDFIQTNAPLFYIELQLDFNIL